MITSNEAGEAAYEKTIISPTPLDPVIAAETLKEVKRIFDDQGIVFWLGSGTCLGCIRENRFIPWDDEMDTASVIGMHDLDEKTVYRIANVFKEHGFYPRIRNNTRYMHVGLIKNGIRTDWTCHHIIDGGAVEFPGVKLPLSIFTQPMEVEFIGQKLEKKYIKEIIMNNKISKKKDEKESNSSSTESEWTTSDDNKLLALYKRNVPEIALSKMFKKQISEIRDRIILLMKK